MPGVRRQTGKTTIVHKTDGTAPKDIPANKTPNIRRNKVRTLRQQIMGGKYEIDKRLDAVCDRLLETIMARRTSCKHGKMR